MKAIHSYQSIKRLLERQGLDKPCKIDPLRITVIKENPTGNEDGTVEKKLPFLHSLPLV